MTLDQYKEQYKGMSAAEVRGLIARSADFRTETEKLYRSIYHKPLNKSCGDCWIDAYILIMRGDQIKLQAMMNKRYNLRAGAVLVDPKDPTKTATMNNITDELAIYHLRIHPTCKRLFSLLPENWEEEVYCSQEDNSDLEGMSAEQTAKEAAEKAEKAAAEAAAKAGAPADGSNAKAPADAPAKQSEGAESKENKKNGTKK